jgi:hypothetical protein
VGVAKRWLSISVTDDITDLPNATTAIVSVPWFVTTAAYITALPDFVGLKLNAIGAHESTPMRVGNVDASPNSAASPETFTALM